jgi:Na+/alanine symporter
MKIKKQRCRAFRALITVIEILFMAICVMTFKFIWSWLDLSEGVSHFIGLVIVLFLSDLVMRRALEK